MLGNYHNFRNSTLNLNLGIETFGQRKLTVVNNIAGVGLRQIKVEIADWAKKVKSLVPMAKLYSTLIHQLSFVLI